MNGCKLIVINDGWHSGRVLAPCSWAASSNPDKVEKVLSIDETLYFVSLVVGIVVTHFSE